MSTISIIWIILFSTFINCVTSADPPNVYRSYQNSIYCNASTRIREPKNVSAIIQIVRKAAAAGLRVKAFGSRHSITDIICTDGIPISMKHINSAVIEDDGAATFGAGIELYDAMEFLEKQKRSLVLVPTFGGITIGGAIGTGAHGSSLLHPTSLSDQVVRLKIINSQGNLLTISSPKEVDKFRVHLGLLGIVVEVTLRTVPLFKMAVQNVRKPENVLFDGSLPHLATQRDMVQAWWFPSTGSVVVATGNYTSVNTPGNAHANFIPDFVPALIAGSTMALDLVQASRNKKVMKSLEKLTERSLYAQTLGIPPLYSEDSEFKNPATGYAWRLQSNKCGGGEDILKRCSWSNKVVSIWPEESSMAFDISQFKGVMTMIKDVLQQYPASFGLVGIFIRFSKASPALMAISSGRTTFTVEWATPMRLNPFDKPKDGIEAYQLILQEMVFNYGGRPHWAKNGLYYTTQPVLEKAFPDRRNFARAMDEYDPKGMLANKFGNRLRGISDDMDLDPRVQHCALQDYCVCKTKFDCANFQTCEKVNQFSICSRPPPMFPLSLPAF